MRLDVCQGFGGGCAYGCVRILVSLPKRRRARRAAHELC